MTSNPAAGDTSAPFAGLISLANSGAQAFSAYEAADAAKVAAKRLNSKDLMWVLLGLGGLGVVALFVFKH